MLRESLPGTQASVKVYFQAEASGNQGSYNDGWVKVVNKKKQNKGKGQGKGKCSNNGPYNRNQPKDQDEDNELMMMLANYFSKKAKKKNNKNKAVTFTNLTFWTTSGQTSKNLKNNILAQKFDLFQTFLAHTFVKLANKF